MKENSFAIVSEYPQKNEKFINNFLAEFWC